MRVLKELVAIISKNKVRQIEVIGNGSDPQSKVHEFYDMVTSGELANDDDAAEHFFNCSAATSSYRNLKNTLKNRLINTAFFIDVQQSKYNEYQRAYFNCWKDWAAAKVLLGKAARLAPLEIAQRVYQQATRYDFTDLILESLRYLRKHYGVFEGNLSLFDKYNTEIKWYSRQFEAEELANELYLILATRYIRNKAPANELHQFALSSYLQLKPMMEEFPSQRLHLFGNLLHIAAHMSINDYQATIDVCKQATLFFESKTYTARTPILIVLHQQLVCQTQLKQYMEGKKVVQRCMELITEDDKYNWFKNLELAFMLAMHSKEYQAAYDYFQMAVEHKFFKYQPRRLKESWKIFQTYLHYLINLGLIEADPEDSRFNKFRLGKFINEVPSFSKEKRRHNIPILIAQILFLILQKRYMEAIDRMEAVDKYCYRYLRKDDTFRSNCFIKTLLVIPACSFHKAAVVRKAGKYLKQLKSAPLEIANQPHEVEIIPYEDLWELALLSLENEFYKEPKQQRRSRPGRL